MRAINIDDLRAAAKRRLPGVIFEFIDGGAQDETTLRANREDFQKWRFRTRTLTDVSKRDQSITLFGQRYASPLILAPTGLAGLLSRRGELAAARAAEKYGVRACALGAKACMIGRAWLYGLASGGQPGVERALEILRDEIDITLTLLGRPTLAEIDQRVLVEKP